MSTFQTFELRERKRLDEEFFRRVGVTKEEYTTAPVATEREGMAQEQIEAETREAAAASERLKQITLETNAKRDAAWERKQCLEKARRERHKHAPRQRKKEPTRKVRMLVYSEVSLEEERDRENNF